MPSAGAVGGEPLPVGRPDEQDRIRSDNCWPDPISVWCLGKLHVHGTKTTGVVPRGRLGGSGGIDGTPVISLKDGNSHRKVFRGIHFLSLSQSSA